MSEKEKEHDELKEKSLKILQFIEELTDKDADGFVKAGNVMGLLGGTIHLFFQQSEKQLGVKRATEIKSAMMLLVKMA
ncbi:MAG: hypothetical protein PUK76_02565 [Treponema sp.]|nr:hypothetical protein [Treponema sp.]